MKGWALRQKQTFLKHETLKRVCMIFTNMEIHWACPSKNLGYTWIYIYTGYTGLLDIFNNGVGLIGYRRGRLSFNARIITTSGSRKFHPGERASAF